MKFDGKESFNFFSRTLGYKYIQIEGFFYSLAINNSFLLPHHDVTRGGVLTADGEFLLAINNLLVDKLQIFDIP